MREAVPGHGGRGDLEDQSAHARLGPSRPGSGLGLGLGLCVLLGPSVYYDTPYVLTDPPPDGGHPFPVVGGQITCRWAKGG